MCIRDRQLGVLEKELWLYRALNGRTIVFSKDIAEKSTTLTYGYDVASVSYTHLDVYKRQDNSCLCIYQLSFSRIIHQRKEPRETYQRPFRNH